MPFPPAQDLGDPRSSSDEQQGRALVATVEAGSESLLHLLSGGTPSEDSARIIGDYGAEHLFAHHSWSYDCGESEAAESQFRHLKDELPRLGWTVQEWQESNMAAATADGTSEEEIREILAQSDLFEMRQPDGCRGAVQLEHGDAAIYVTINCP